MGPSRADRPRTGRQHRRDIHTSRTHLIITATPAQLAAAAAHHAGGQQQRLDPALDLALGGTLDSRLDQHDQIGGGNTGDPDGDEPDETGGLAEGPLFRPGAYCISSATTLTRGALRRLSCDAIVSLVAVQEGTHDPLLVSRSARTVTASQWIALVLRDGHCVVRGCRRPPSACIAHHVRHWADGGTSDLPNLVLLCEQHHHDHHDRQIDLPHHDRRRWMTQTGWAWYDGGWTDEEPTPALS